NAVDAIAGKMWLDDMRGDDKVFYTTGRLTSEMVIKGAQMGMPFLLSRSGTTQMGHMVADKLGMSLLARCTGTHFLLLTGKDRFIFDPHLQDGWLRVACAISFERLSQANRRVGRARGRCHDHWCHPVVTLQCRVT